MATLYIKMKKTLSTFSLLASLLVFNAANAETRNTSYQVQQKDIYEGYIVEKIWLNDYSIPKIALSGIEYSANVALPANAKTSDPNKFEIKIGMERKRPFAVVRIPAYTPGAVAGSANMVRSFTLTIEENPAPATSNAAAKSTGDVTSSVLSSGAWYKIAVPKTGFFKIDFNFLSSLGLSGAEIAAINPANIRVYGNGGSMLSENNAVDRPVDLLENAISVTGNGDNTFDNGDAAIFYAMGPTRWAKDSFSQRFFHVKNLYSDSAFYFLTFDRGAGMRIQPKAASGAGNVTVNSFNFYDVHDTDIVNPATLGKNWYGEKFLPQLGNTSQTFTFDMGPSVSCVYCAVSFAATSDITGNKVAVAINGANIGSSNLAVTVGDDVMSMKTLTGQGACNEQMVNVNVTFTPASSNSAGYLNYIEVNGRRSLTMNGAEQLSFRDWKSVGAGNIATYQLDGANSNTQVWDVTNPQNPVLMQGSLSGSVYTFTCDAGYLHEFAAINSANVPTPAFIGKVTNQNLHGLPQADLIIVSHPLFLTQAKDLADFHTTHDKLRTVVATPQEIYNEFSSGGQDISAIRDFVRMFYKRAGSDTTQMPKYLLLMGGASYDYKYRTANNSNFVPVFESAESLNDLNSFSCDDFYGFLDDKENIEENQKLNALDIGIGRLPARSVDDAVAMVSKIKSYSDPATLGPWRISATVVADNNDNAGCHMCDAETMAETITQNTNNLFNIQKIYVDATPTVSTPAGPRCPNASSSIDNSIFKGTMMMNYNGHGNTEVWASERILTQDNFNNWSNKNMLPFMVTATCDFGQFDHPQFVSAAERLVLKKGGGVIAMLTTTQAVFAVFNHELNTQYIDAQYLRKSNGFWNTFGDACRISKNVTYVRSFDGGQLANFRKFSLLGDPAVIPNFPEYNITIDGVTDGATASRADTLKALGKYEIKGSVRDHSGSVMTGFNGPVYVTIFDKARNISTITTPVAAFKMQDNVIYKGKATVTNGQFSITFITPKDINYYFGTGKISAYAHNGDIDAAGADTSFKIGGFSDNAVTSATDPLVKPYINDTLFQNGGITGSNTSLYVRLFSETGINVSGNSIGHDLTAVLDDNVENPYILNDYYETEANTYQRGFVNFPVNGLADGRHTFTVKAWDVIDNSGIGKIDFTVVDGKIADIDNLGNYPNPFTNFTRFVFEHNHPDEQLDVEINIFTADGVMVKDIKETFTPTGSRTNELTWDGTDSQNRPLAAGVYVYRLTMATSKGFKSSAYQKLVIVR